MSRLTIFAEKRSASLLILIIGYVLAGVVFYVADLALKAGMEAGSGLAVGLNSFMGIVLVSPFPS